MKMESKNKKDMNENLFWILLYSSIIVGGLIFCKFWLLILTNN